MQPKALEIFLKLIRIYSPSFQENQLRLWIIKHLKKLKIKTKIDSTGNIIAKLPGRGRPLILAAHLDTVEPCGKIRPIIKNGVIRSNGKTILGADDKAGLASILAVVAKITKEKSRCRPLELIFTVQEEACFGGSKKLQYQKIRGQEAVVLDSSAPTGSIIISAPYIYTVEVECKGKPASLRNLKNGVNAIQMFCSFANALTPSRENKNVISNIGTLRAGTSTNVVPGRLVASGEMRSLDLKSIQKEIKFWRKKAAQVSAKYNGKIKLTMKLLSCGFSLSQKNPFVQTLSRSISKAGFRPQYTTTVGGSDANIFNRRGITAVPLGQGRSNGHSLNESMPIKALIEMEKILLQLIKLPG